MAVKRLSVSFDESVAERAASAAASHGVSLSAWLNAAAERAIRIEDGLAAVREWEAEHGELSAEERAWDDKAIADDQALLDEIVPEFGGRSAAIKQGIAMLADDHRRRRALEAFMEEWSAESGPPDPDGVAAMSERFFSQR